MKKVLMIASVPSMIGQFNMNNIKILKKLGYQVDVACDFNDSSVWTIDRINEFKNELDNLKVKSIQIDFSRAPLSLVNHIKAYMQVKEIIKKNNYLFVHTHTPITSAIVRIACKKADTKVIYTAHGFHFYKGAPLLNWIFYYPIEKHLAKYTDILITINQEDCKCSSENFKSVNVKYVPGIGVDVNSIDIINERKNKFHRDLNISKDKKIVISIGELSKRKNHEVVIRALKDIPNVVYIICGKGNMEESLNKLAIENCVDLRLLGFRKDCIELIKSSDIFVFPSLQEGLPVALMEAMACGIPIIASKIRGNMDLIIDGRNGYLYDCKDVNGFKKGISFLINNKEISMNFDRLNKVLVKNYDNSKVNIAMTSVYEKICD